MSNLDGKNDSDINLVITDVLEAIKNIDVHYTEDDTITPAERYQRIKNLLRLVMVVDLEFRTVLAPNIVETINTMSKQVQDNVLHSSIDLSSALISCTASIISDLGQNVSSAMNSLLSEFDESVYDQIMNSTGGIDGANWLVTDTSNKSYEFIAGVKTKTNDFNKQMSMILADFVQTVQTRCDDLVSYAIGFAKSIEATNGETLEEDARRIIGRWNVEPHDFSEQDFDFKQNCLSDKIKQTIVSIVETIYSVIDQDTGTIQNLVDSFINDSVQTVQKNESIAEILINWNRVCSRIGSDLLQNMRNWISDCLNSDESGLMRLLAFVGNDSGAKTKFDVNETAQTTRAVNTVLLEHGKRIEQLKESVKCASSKSSEISSSSVNASEKQNDIVRQKLQSEMSSISNSKTQKSNALNNSISALTGSSETILEVASSINSQDENPDTQNAPRPASTSVDKSAGVADEVAKRHQYKNNDAIQLWGEEKIKEEPWRGLVSQLDPGLLKGAKEDYEHMKQNGTVPDWLKEITGEKTPEAAPPQDGGQGDGQGSDTTPTNSDAPASGQSPSSPDSGKSGSENPSAQPLADWKGFDPDIKSGLEFLMHDGDQQLFNPYGNDESKWTMYSFRPNDAKQTYPQIAITPSSFNALQSMDVMLDNVPYIVVKEYFFKNVAGTMADFVEKIMKTVKEASIAPTENAGNQASGGAKSQGNTLLDKIKKVFEKVGPTEQVIEIPYVLYIGLRERLYGNTYIFPYIVSSSTIINSANNDSEWNKGGGFLEIMKSAINNIGNAIGGLAASAMGSQSTGANLFPAPTWGGPGEDKVSFSFDLILINDHAVRTRNNYMCVNTIINNNRSMQKSLLAFPGALYEVWLPTGQRHLMCTGDFKLYPLGLNRRVPKDFFTWSFHIGSQKPTPMATKHKENEVIPDGYKLSCTFKSCLANNLNTSVFQYYVKMTTYDDGVTPMDADAKTANPGSTVKSELAEKALGFVSSGLNKSASSIGTLRTRDEEDENIIETFEESTFKKALTVIKSFAGDESINSDSAIDTIRKTSSVIRESEQFLKKLYNAEKNNLWYKPFEKEEYYTTLKPEYRDVLKKEYGEKFNQILAADKTISDLTQQQTEIQERLSRKIPLDERNQILEQKVEVMNLLTKSQNLRTGLVDDILTIDTNMIQAAFDVEDDVVSLNKVDITSGIVQQVWNEKIMNSYEKDKLQYMTSKEKEIYFQDKIRELQKYDQYGILNHQDWFFRVVVLDCIVYEMNRLVIWFKDCTYNDIDTIYRIVRKLRMLMLDIEQIRSNQEFNINKTNLFYLSDETIKQFNKIDDMLNGSTLYELFQNQMKIKFIPFEKQDDAVKPEQPTERQKELVKEQNSEMESTRRRIIRQDIVTRYWGNEMELTKEAYNIANTLADEETITVPDTNGNVYQFNSLNELKNRILDLKIQNKKNDELKCLLGAFTNRVAAIKEGLILDKIRDMKNLASETIQTKDDTTNADALKPLDVSE